MKGNYDNVAGFYDKLSKLIYGDAILQSHLFLINAISANSSILIAGGGTGFILEEISKKYAVGLQITYVEISKKMMALSKKRNVGNNTVFFINQSIHDVTFGQLFDVVITPFLFDNFNNGTIRSVFNKTNFFLKPHGFWLLADFRLSENNNLWQKLLLKLMYFFFKIFCNIEASKLSDTGPLFIKNNYDIVSMKTFYKDFIYAVIYKKQ